MGEEAEFTGESRDGGVEAAEKFPPPPPGSKLGTTYNKAMFAGVLCVFVTYNRRYNGGTTPVEERRTVPMDSFSPRGAWFRVQRCNIHRFAAELFVFGRNKGATEAQQSATRVVDCWGVDG